MLFSKDLGFQKSHSTTNILFTSLLLCWNAYEKSGWVTHHPATYIATNIQ